MRVFINLLFLTFVLASSIGTAAPNTSNNVKPSEFNSNPIPAPLWKHDQSPYRFSLYGGFSGGNFFDADKTLATALLGFRFSYRTNEDHAWDYNAEVKSPENLIALHFGKRYSILSTSAFAPYYKLAAGTQLKADNALANFVEIKRWQARASGGFNNLFNSDYPLYAEAGLGIAVVGLEYFAILGVDFNF